jgi:hypothetical protein
MSVKINASTSSGLVVDSDLTGSLRLQTGGNDALTVDSSQVVNFTKQFQFGGVLPPAFFAYQNASSQSLTGGSATKVTLDAELFDTNNNFASSRFTPTVAGYYQLSAAVQVAASNQEIVAYIRKNNSDVMTGLDIVTGAYNSTVTGIQYANGTTDYFEVYCYVSSTRSVSNYATNTYFTGSLVRAA